MEQYLSMAAVVRIVGLSRQVIWRRRRAGTFPEPVKLGSLRPLRFLRSEITQWMQARQDERDAEIAARKEALK